MLRFVSRHLKSNICRKRIWNKIQETRYNNQTITNNQGPIIKQEKTINPNKFLFGYYDLNIICILYLDYWLLRMKGA